jgi:hypothetical protein
MVLSDNAWHTRANLRNGTYPRFEAVLHGFAQSPRCVSRQSRNVNCIDVAAALCKRILSAWWVRNDHDS